jgi:TolB-like protein/DNA-binding winged helix-turn-helix (wHTH) protein
MAVLASESEVERIDLAKEFDFELGGVTVKPSERVVEVNGERRELQPRVMQVLVALARVRPSVVSRDRLIEQCWDGRVVGDDALNRCILALRHLAEGVSPQPFTIETVPRVGHRMVEEANAENKEARPGKSISWRHLVGLAVLLMAIAGGLYLWQQRNAAAEPASIAVLPFRNLGTGDPYLAEGIGEEILGQLAREPHFRVAGRSSSSQFGDNPNVNEVAERLNVDYVLEGSVRRQGDQVRVNAGLLRASDGMRLWADSYDGKLDDIFAIQREIGAAIAGALQRKLVRAPALAGALVTKGEAYDLYLTARSLIRTRNRRIGPTAVDLLRDAIQLDPGYAPAWASLAEATQLQGALGDREAYIAALRKSDRFAKHAVALAPNLPEAHRALGLNQPYGDPVGIAHLHRAAELVPNDSENQLALAAAFNATGEFDRELAAYRRAHELDPLWFRTTGSLALAIAARGSRAEAEAVARRGRPEGASGHNLMGRIAWTFADYSEAVRRWKIVIQSRSPRWGHVADRMLRDATQAVGVRTEALVDVPGPTGYRGDWRAWMDAAPAPAEWRKRNRDAVAAGVHRKHNLVAAKLMLNTGRWRELVATYDGPVGLFELGPRRRVRVDQILEAPVVALALRQAGRNGEAEKLMREFEATVRTVYRRGEIPFWFDVDAAALFAVQGREDVALDALERAYRRGWRQNSGTSLRDIADEPAFRSLHDEPRFKRLQRLLADHYARERREVEAVLRQNPASSSMPI